MRIFSKKAFQFDHPTGAESSVVVQSQSFADVPDWVAKSSMFALASSAEEVTVIESKGDEKKATRRKPTEKPEGDPEKPDGGQTGGEQTGDQTGGEPPAGDLTTPPAE